MKFSFKNKIENLVNSIERNSWVFTIFIFLMILVGAVIIWNDCVLNPRPSKIAWENILKTEKEYQNKMNKIKENDKKIKDRLSNFNNPQINLKEREYFKQDFRDDYYEPVNISNTDNYNPKIVN
jgi:hypothetical protein